MDLEPPYWPREEFHPTPADLIDYYLKNHIIGRPYLDSDVIQSATIFGDNLNPWERFCSPEWQWRTDLHDTPILYLFTKLSNIGKTSKSTNLQKKRTAGCGTWHGNTKPIKVKSFDGENLVIGHCRRLSFRTANNEKTVGQWNMCEYNICGEAFPELQGLDWEDWVVCSIKRDDSKYSIGHKVFSVEEDVSSAEEEEEEELAPVAKKSKIDNGDQVTVEWEEEEELAPVAKECKMDNGDQVTVEWEDIDINLMFNLDDLLNPLPQDWIELEPEYDSIL